MKRKHLLLLLLFSFSTNSAPLYSLIREAVMHDPIVMEARAELTSAQSRIEQASSAHWPVVTATGSKLLSQSHRYSYDYDTEDILPGIRGEVNIFASGAIEADVRRSESEAEYYHYKWKKQKRKQFTLLFHYILMHSGKTIHCGT